MKSNRRVKLSGSEYRVLLSEVLPYETPISFGNVGLYNFVRSMGLRQLPDRTGFALKSGRPGTSVVMKILLGEDLELEAAGDSYHSGDKSQNSSGVILYLLNQSGNRLSEKRVDFPWTVPLQFGIRHKEHDLRVLSIPHPRAQLDAVDLYREYGSAMLQHTRGSDFSIRFPSKRARYTVKKDTLFSRLESDGLDHFETHGAEYDRYHSYFKYKRYSNIHRFYDSPEYLACERKYGYLLRVDVAKCFDSIYTHTVSWATHGKEVSKKHLRKKTADAFPVVFDTFMQSQNHGETSGILIGPELSRIFSEIVLQSVDKQIGIRLEDAGFAHKRDYEILRYVDDYFVFLSDSSKETQFVDVIREELRHFKLSLNSAKHEGEHTPLRSLRSIAKRRVKRSIAKGVRVRKPKPILMHLNAGADDLTAQTSSTRLKIPKLSSRSLILDYKAILFDTEVDHAELANYTAALLEAELEEVLAQVGSLLSHAEGIDRGRAETEILDALVEIVEFAFFIYSGCPKVGLSIRLARMVSTALNFCEHLGLPDHQIDRLRHRISSELGFQLRRQKLYSGAVVESLYLLEIATSLGPAFRLPSRQLADLFGLEFNESACALNLRDWKGGKLSMFALLGLLSYMRSDAKYNSLRAALESHISKRYAESGRGIGVLNDAEMSMLSLDLLACPYISTELKHNVLKFYGEEDELERAGAMELSQRWFTDWNGAERYYSELLLKRRQPVY